MSLTKKQLISRCKKIANGTGLWCEDDLEGFLDEFCPNGKGLTELYQGVLHGEEIVPRIQELFVAKKRDLETTNQQAIRLLKKFVVAIKSLGIEMDNAIISQVGEFTEFRLDATSKKQSRRTHQFNNNLCDEFDGEFSVFDTNVQGARAMDAAIWSLTGDFFLTYFAQWPIFQSQFETEDPFRYYFELWRRNIVWNVSKGGVIVFSIL